VRPRTVGRLLLVEEVSKVHGIVWPGGGWSKRGCGSGETAVLASPVVDNSPRPGPMPTRQLQVDS